MSLWAEFLEMGEKNATREWTTNEVGILVSMQCISAWAVSLFRGHAASIKTNWFTITSNLDTHDRTEHMISAIIDAQ